MTLRKAVQSLTNAFRAAGMDTPELDARLLAGAAMGLSRERLIVDAERLQTPDEGRRLEEMCRRRLAREPVSRILGSRNFWTQSFAINSATLDPRPDSEALIETVLAILDFEGRRAEPLNILDLGTGSGCLLLSLLAELPLAKGLGTDISAMALAAARQNAQTLCLSGRVEFLVADWLENVHGVFDLVISNPPYIASSEIETLEPEVARYDPRLALDGGQDGLQAYRRIIPRLAGITRTGAWAAFETGSHQTGPAQHLLAQSGFALTLPLCGPILDLAGQPRGVAGKRQA